MVEFGMAMRLSDDDKKLIEPVMEPIDKAIIWTNDYWSFDREYHESINSGTRLTNVVEVVRRTENSSIDEAKAKVRQLIVDLEQQYLEGKSLIYAQNPSLPFHVRKWIEVVGSTVAGTHYWASCAPRHHAWKSSFGSRSSEDSKLTPTQSNPEINAQDEFMKLNYQFALDNHDMEQFMRALLALLSAVVRQCESLFGGGDQKRTKLIRSDEATKGVLSFEVCSKLFFLDSLPGRGLTKRCIGLQQRNPGG